jgi:hypothetical protein
MESTMSDLALRVLPKSYVYKLHRAKYFAAGGSPVVATDPKVNELVSRLKKDGVVVVPGFVDRDKALAAGSAMRAKALDIIRQENPTNKFHNLPKYGIVRILKAETLDQVAAEFFGSKLIEDIAKAYTCEKIVSWQRMFEIRDDKPLVGSADEYHIDEAFYYKFKAFLYLSDVTPETAPYTYLKGSNQDASWRQERMKRMLGHDIYGPISADGDRGTGFDTRQIDFLSKHYNYEPIACCGPAGTLILTDTNGIHKGTTPISGGRLMLGHYYELPRKGIWPPTNKNAVY